MNNHQNPKILLIDLEKDVGTFLQSKGISLSEGSFGKEYIIDGVLPEKLIVTNDDLPKNYAEYELIVIDLNPHYTPETITPKPHSYDITYLAETLNRNIDPRPLSMIQKKRSFDTIFDHGGIFVIFSNKTTSLNYRVSNKGKTSQELKVDNWSFLKIFNLDSISIAPYEGGNNMEVINNQSPLGKLLYKYSKDAFFNCTFSKNYKFDKRTDSSRWTSLATNKFKEIVSFHIYFPDTKGSVYIFPQIENKQEFLHEFFTDILCHQKPTIFPSLGNQNWLFDSRYEHDEILEIKKDMSVIEKEFQEKIEIKNSEIEKIRLNNKFLHDLITETGDPLVDAVKKTLETLGFEDVVNMDKKEDPKDKGTKREDLQIRDDGDPLLLIEVKGIGGLPSEDDALQVYKYIIPRMKKEERFDVKGLSIINIQKGMDPVFRQNSNPFQEDVITNANSDESGFGIMTTWDLFRVLKSFLDNNWKHEHIKSVFYKNGRISLVPEHYHLLGSIEEIFKKPGAIVIKIEGDSLKRGDRISFELFNGYQEQTIDSLQDNGVDVGEIKKGGEAGIKTNLVLDQLKKGTLVYKIINS